MGAPVPTETVPCMANPLDSRRPDEAMEREIVAPSLIPRRPGERRKHGLLPPSSRSSVRSIT